MFIALLSSFLLFSNLFSSNYVYNNYISKNFKIPKGLEQSVDFWIDIFTKYDVNELVIHDSKYNIVYETINTSDIMSLPYFSASVKQEMVNSRVLRVKKKYEDALKLLEKQQYQLDDPFLYKLYKKFSKIRVKNKFLFASRPGRIRTQQGHRANFRKAIYYSSYHLKDMERVFKRYGLPKELTRIPFIESFFNPQAVSHKRATGVWQFMPATGKEYMRVSSIYDERRDPALSTVAAAKMLKKSYKYLKDWSLAVTGYNYGMYGLKKAKKIIGARNIVDLIKYYDGRRFGFASRNYYAEFLAAVFIEKNYRRFFGRIQKPSFAFSKILKIKKRMSFSQLETLLGLDSRTIKKYNPAIADYFFSGTYRLPVGAKIRLPKFYFRRFYANRRLSRYFSIL